MKNILAPCSFLSASLLVACATHDASVPVPDAPALSVPENSAAADMTNSFTSLMQRKLPLLDRVAVITARDQYVRGVFIPQFSDPGLDQDTRKQFQDAAGKYVTRIDTLNTFELKEVLEDYSWGEIIDGDPVLFERVFPVVQHSPDNAFRRSVLEEIRPFAEAGKINQGLYATMYDRVQISDGEQQLYGTQYKCVNGQYDSYDLAEPETVDARRAGMGLEPLAAYLEQGRKFHGPCLDN